jgi:hypothetical protein
MEFDERVAHLTVSLMSSMLRCSSLIYIYKIHKTTKMELMR